MKRRKKCRNLFCRKQHRQWSGLGIMLRIVIRNAKNHCISYRYIVKIRTIPEEKIHWKNIRRGEGVYGSRSISGKEKKWGNVFSLFHYL
jgi:hypothetical protein